MKDLPKISELLKQPEKMRVMCAEACGLKITQEIPYLEWVLPSGESKAGSRLDHIIPTLEKYDTSLDAMAEAEATLTDAEFEVYAFWVAWIAPLGKQIVASAIDRLKAFLIAKGLAQP